MFGKDGIESGPGITGDSSVFGTVAVDFGEGTKIEDVLYALKGISRVNFLNTRSDLFG